MKHATTLRALALTLSAAIPLAASAAGESAMKLQTELAKLQDSRTVREVRFVMDIPFAEQPIAQTPAGLQRSGCQYRTSNPERIAAVVIELREADLLIPATRESRELRQSLNLEYADGTTMAFEFGEVFPADTSVHGSVNGMAVTARTSLQTDLFRWAASLPDRVARCEGVLAGYR